MQAYRWRITVLEGLLQPLIQILQQDSEGGSIFNVVELEILAGKKERD